MLSAGSTAAMADIEILYMGVIVRRGFDRAGSYHMTSAGVYADRGYTDPMESELIAADAAANQDPVNNPNTSLIKIAGYTKSVAVHKESIKKLDKVSHKAEMKSCRPGLKYAEKRLSCLRQKVYFA